MNNVDKSLVTFDLALRRRFGFFKLMPKLEVISEVLGGIVEEDLLDKYHNKCKQLNILISKSNQYIYEHEKELFIGVNYQNMLLELGDDYQIGHAYFLKMQDFLVKNDNKESQDKQIITSFELEKLWVYHLEPLLEEYLGMSIEEEEVLKKLKNLKDEFLKDN